MPQLELETVESIAEDVVANLKFPFEYAERKWILTSDALRKKIKADIITQLHKIPFSDAEIDFINANPELVAGKLEFSKRMVGYHYSSGIDAIDPYQVEVIEGNIVTGDKVIQEGLSKVYYQGLDHKRMQYVGALLFSADEKSETVATNDTLVVDPKKIHQCIFELYLQKCNLAQLEIELTKLHDETEPRTKFIRATQRFPKSWVSTYADTATWCAEVKAIRDRAAAIPGGTEESKAISFKIAHCVYEIKTDASVQPS